MNSILDISTSALTAQRARLDVIAGNIATRDATRMENGQAVPYRRRAALLAPGQGPKNDSPGVHVHSIVEDPAPFGKRWDPHHPDAIQSGADKGYVLTSNVNYHTEMVDAMTASRAYEANVTVIEMAKSLARQSLRLLA